MRKIPPIQLNIETGFSDNLNILSWLEFRSTFYGFQQQSSGWFSKKYGFTPLPFGKIVTINPMKMGVWFGNLTDDMLRSPFPVLTNDTMDDVFDNLNEYSRWLHAVGQWETVNSHQWNGDQPVQNKNDRGVVLEIEPARWEIAAPVDAERLMLYNGHNTRDEVYSLTVRMNQFCDYWRTLINPIHDELKELKNMEDSDDVDEDEYRSKRGELYNYILDNYRENPPPWD